MGWLANRRARKAQEAFQGQMATWNEEDAHLRTLLEQARTFEGEASVEGETVQLKQDERIFLIVQSCPLVEPRRGPGHYQGGYQGISIPIGDTGLRYRVGAGRGTMVPGTEKPLSSTRAWPPSPASALSSRAQCSTRVELRQAHRVPAFRRAAVDRAAGVEPPEDVGDRVRRGVVAQCAVHARARLGPLQPPRRPVRGTARGRGGLPSRDAAGRRKSSRRHSACTVTESVRQGYAPR